MAEPSGQREVKPTVFGGAGTRIVLLVLLFATAFGLRMINIDKPQLGFLSMRELFCAHSARLFYFQHAPDVPEWRKSVNAAIARNWLVPLEAPIVQYFASVGYRAIGHETLAFPRMRSTLFWLIGGVLLYRLALRVSSPGAAVFATAFFILCPFGIIAGRNFQPDPFMMMWLIAALLAIARFEEKPSVARLLAASLLAAAAVLAKPQCVFVLFVVFAFVAVRRLGFRRTVFGPVLPVFVLVTLLPAAAYYGYHMSNESVLADWAGRYGLLSRWFQPFFWARWLWMIDTVVGAAALVAAVLGLLFIRKGLPRTLLIGGFCGYTVFGLVFTYHISTHNYYSLQLIPFVALSLGVLVERLLTLAFAATPQWYWRWVAYGALLLAIPLSLPTVYREFILHEPDYEKEVLTARHIGELVGHSTKTILLGDAWGEVLRYYGEVSGPAWPTRADLARTQSQGANIPSAKEQFDGMVSEGSPDYFIVTDFKELDAQPELGKMLFERFPVLARGDDYLIFDLRAPKPEAH